MNLIYDVASYVVDYISHKIGGDVGITKIEFYFRVRLHFTVLFGNGMTACDRQNRHIFIANTVRRFRTLHLVMLDE